ncbi:asparagine synthase-related protein [Streptomyces gamaensis]|uniref:Asparagine synthase-related protein n=1 Tax=Streptomyces gamaensis TaxID=1763542 RepID=A0ABW0YXU2_9ACTN
MGETPSWFVTLPDCPCPPLLLRRLRQYARYGVAHPSGRPWLLGSWPADRMGLAWGDTARLAVAGTCAIGPAGLADRLRHVRGLADVETAVRDVPGSFHVAAAVDGCTYVRGSLSGERRVYWTTVDGFTVCADRARTLAWLTRARLDTAQLAARLVTPYLPYPLAGGAMWRGIHGLPPGQALRVEPDGACHTSTWWRPPDSELPLPEAASGLRTALREAVAVRVRPGEVLGADLSGGMDSTSLCFLAAEAGAKLVTATFHWGAPGNEDPLYARHASGRLPHLARLVLPPQSVPALFSGLRERHDAPDEPSAALRDRLQQRYIAGSMRAYGAVRRLTGHGGDHLVRPPDAYVHTLLRRAPLEGLRHAAALRAHRRWPLGATVRMLLDSRPYAAHLAGAAAMLRDGVGRGPVPEGWGPWPCLPPWASDEAFGMVEELLGAASGEPLAADRGRHAWLQQAQQAGRIAALITHETTAAGLPAHSPFCDDAVISACLAASPRETGGPWVYKPLLAAAMEGIVPERVLRRTTKDHCGQEWQLGMRLHRRELAAWAEESHLVAAGVVDAEPLRRALLSPGLLGGGAADLEFTLGAEEWLRDLAARPAPACLSRETPVPRTEPEGVPVEPTAR